MFETINSWEMDFITTIRVEWSAGHKFNFICMLYVI